MLSAESLLMQKSIADKTLRIHIIANSNATEDQTQKLRLRDHVLEKISLITTNCNSIEETENVLMEHLEELENSARAFLREEGCGSDVSVSLETVYFRTRDYGTFSLPAGNYRALRVIIGSGEGKNWWCVVFPTLCNASSMEELEESAWRAGYDQEELAMIRKEEPKYKIRFKMVEILSALFR